MRGRAFRHLLVRDDQGEERNSLSCPRGHLEYAVSLLEHFVVEFVINSREITVASRVRLRSHM